MINNMDPKILELLQSQANKQPDLENPDDSVYDEEVDAIRNSPEYQNKIAEQKRKIEEFKAAQTQAAPVETKTAPVQQEAPATPTQDPRLTAALEQQSKQRRYSDLLRGFQQMVAAGGGIKADTSMADIMNQRADEPVAQYKAQIAQEAAGKKEARENKESDLRMEDFQMRIAKSKLDFTDMQANSDPASPQSKIAQDRVIEMQKKLGQPVNEEQIRGQSGAQLFKYFDYLKQDLAQFYQNENHRLDREQKQKSDDTRLSMEQERNKRFDDMEQRRIGKETRQENEGDRRYRQQQINTARGLIKDDPRFKKSMEQSMAFDDVDALIAEAQKGNQQAVGALGTKLARAMGEVGVLTESDVVRYVAGQSWGRKLKDWATKGATGELSPETIKGIKDNLGILKTKLSGDVGKVVSNSASRMKAAYPEMTDEDINGLLGFTSKQTQSDTVKMKNKEGRVFNVPKDKVEAAKASGGEVIE